MIPISQVLALARAGNPARAWELFRSSGWDQRTDDPKALTLKGRLLKDQAKGSVGDERNRLYGEAAAAYVAAAAIRTDSYPLINAAALALLGGDPDRAAGLAAQVLELIESNPEEGENTYWRGATRSEALLLMDRNEEAQDAFALAIAELPYAWEDHAATIGQFALILAKQHRDAGWLNQYRPPVSIHFSGMIRMQPDHLNTPAAIENFIVREQPGFAYGALAAGSDLLFAQAFLDNKAKRKSEAELHVILPFPVEQFRDLSVRPFGDIWLARFDAVMERAETLSILGLDDPPLALAIEMADRVAMGQAVRNAQNLHSIAKAVTVSGLGETLRPQLAAWQNSSHELIVIEGNRKQTSVGEFVHQDTQQSIGTLIWFSGVEEGVLVGLLDYGARLHQSGKGFWIASCDLAEAFALSTKVAQAGLSDIQVSMLHCIMDTEAPSSDLLNRASSFASVSQHGAVTTDHSSAMALTLIGVAESIEEIGELKTAWGAQSLWRII